MILLVVFIFALSLVALYRQRSGSERRAISIMVVKDQSGKVQGRHRIRERKPDHFAENGLVHLGPYVERLFAAPCWSAHLSVCSPSEPGISLSKMDGYIHFVFMLRWRQTGGREVKIRESFESLSLEKGWDYLSGDGTLRIMNWWVEGDAEEAAEVLRELLQTAYGIADHDSLDVSYEERRRRPRKANPSRPSWAGD